MNLTRLRTALLLYKVGDMELCLPASCVSIEMNSKLSRLLRLVIGKYDCVSYCVQYAAAPSPKQKEQQASTGLLSTAGPSDCSSMAGHGAAAESGCSWVEVGWL